MARAFACAPADEMSVREAAEVLGLHENTVRKLCDDGVLAHRRLPFSGFRRPLRESVAEERERRLQRMSEESRLRGRIARQTYEPVEPDVEPDPPELQDTEAPVSPMSLK